jgi:hypothetical protein
MNTMPCAFEIETIRASQTGSASPELLRHQQGCPHCGAALQIARIFHQDAEYLSEHAAPPPAAQVWAAAGRRRRAIALERATILLRILKVSGLVYAAVFIVWAANALANLRGGFVPPVLDGKALNASLEGAVLAALCVGIGLCYTLRHDRPPTR